MYVGYIPNRGVRELLFLIEDTFKTVANIVI